MELKCPKCAGAMERGILVDHQEGFHGRPAVWMLGEAEYGIFGTLKTRGRKQLRVDMLRCTACGYLEAYATRNPGD